jgi:hypothetical protein
VIEPRPHLRFSSHEIPFSQNAPQPVHPLETAPWTASPESRGASPFLSHRYMYFLSQPVWFDIVTKYPGGRGTSPHYVSPPASAIFSMRYRIVPPAVDHSPHGNRGKTRNPDIALSCHSERSEESLSRLVHPDPHTPAASLTRIDSKVWRAYGWHGLTVGQVCHVSTCSWCGTILGG